jgi:hypothetical protein
MGPNAKHGASANPAKAIADMRAGKKQSIEKSRDKIVLRSTAGDDVDEIESPSDSKRL